MSELFFVNRFCGVLLWEQRVAGSNPVSPTISLLAAIYSRFHFITCCFPTISGDFPRLLGESLGEFRGNVSTRDTSSQDYVPIFFPLFVPIFEFKLKLRRLHFQCGTFPQPVNISLRLNLSYLYPITPKR